MSEVTSPETVSVAPARLELIERFPPMRTDLEPISAPIAEVTLLEDRAQVRRSARLAVRAGQQRLVIEGVAPVLQDVSVQATVVGGTAGARVADVMVQRAMRIVRHSKPESIRLIDDEIRVLQRSIEDSTELRERCVRRLEAVMEMLQHASSEVPQDAAWGRVDTRSWEEGFGRLFDQSHELARRWLEAGWQIEDATRELSNAELRRQSLARPDHSVVAWLELEVVAECAGEVELAVEYVVPNALWRPLHLVRLVEREGGASAALVVESQAAVWQNTGEDWTDVALVCSTAQGSLGIEPPLLDDDLLQARKRADQVVVEQREVEIQRAGVGGGGSGGGPGGGAPRAVELPGVDDGGEVQNLRALEPVTVPSDGRPAFVRLFTFEDSESTARLVVVPELAERVFLEVRGQNRSASPLLAGPVELVRQSGSVGWTQTLFVAPGEPFELGFGPQHEVRVKRDARVVREVVDPVDQWRRRQSQVQLFVSNLTDTPRTLHITERVPVSELEHVRVSLLSQLEVSATTRLTSDAWTQDADGLCRLEVTLDAYSQRTLRLCWELAVAPGVAF